jgi:Cu(I)/Ag(I) efflux system periplasmic protein CusF
VTLPDIQMQLREDIVMKPVAIAVLGIVVGLWALPSLAADAASQRIVVAQAAVADSAMTDGEVKKVDKDAGKLTIKHGPLTNLDMPGMTMVFRVKDPAMLDQVKEGDKIRFIADRVNGAITVVELKSVK